MSEKTNDAQSLIDLTFEQLQTDYLDGRYEDGLYCACIIYLMSRKDPNERYKSAAVAFMYECSKEIQGNEDRSTDSTKRCSFCSKAPPDVTLGAGPAAFICNECVRLFSVTLK